MHSFSISDSTYHLCTLSLKSYRPLFCHYPSTTFLLHTPTITTPSILYPLPLPSKPQVPWHHSSLPPAQQTNTRPKRLPLLHPPCFRPRYATTSAPLPPPETYLTLGFREEKRPTGGGSHAMGLLSRCSISVRDFLCLLKRASPTHSTPSHLSFFIRILSSLLYPAWFCSTSSLCHRARS